MERSKLLGIPYKYKHMTMRRRGRESKRRRKF
jgi:hypothetical protein